MSAVESCLVRLLLTTANFPHESGYGVTIAENRFLNLFLLITRFLGPVYVLHSMYIQHLPSMWSETTRYLRHGYKLKIELLIIIRST